MKVGELREFATMKVRELGDLITEPNVFLTTLKDKIENNLHHRLICSFNFICTMPMGFPWLSYGRELGLSSVMGTSSLGTLVLASHHPQNWSSHSRRTPFHYSYHCMQGFHNPIIKSSISNWVILSDKPTFSLSSCQPSGTYSKQHGGTQQGKRR